MKNRRSVLWLSIGLFVSLAAHILLSYKGGVSAALVKRSTLLDESLAAANTINILHPQDKAILLKKYSEWHLTSPYWAIADERAILKMLDLLSSSEIEEAIDDNELLKLGRNREDYGLAQDQATKVVITGDKGTSTIYFGTLTPAGDGVYATVDNEDAVYVVNSNVFGAVDIPASLFRERSLLQLWDGAIVGFDIKNGSGNFMRFEKDGESWLMKEPVRINANTEKIHTLITLLSQTEASDFVWPTGAKGENSIATASLLAGYGLDPDTATTLTFKCVDGIDRQIAFGNNAKDGNVYALIQNAGAIVIVNSKLKEEALANIAEFTDSRLFAVEPSSIARIAIKDGETSYLLIKNENGSWRIESPIVADADDKKVESLIEKIISLKSENIDPDGISVQLASSSQPMMVNRKATIGDIKLEELASRTILSIVPEEVKRIVVTQADKNSTSVIYDSGRSCWSIEKSSLKGDADEEAIKTILETLNPLSARRVVNLKASSAEMKEYGLGLDSQNLTIAIDRKNENSVRRNIRIGNLTEEGAYATIGAADAIFLIDLTTLENLSTPLVKEK
ncbi:MAG: DUF4340 domain-containing protein [Kiritimatiellae bacterium]|nr:DUF4340 domain-containing protein [Kiritimatiellia bacterium]